MIAFRSTLRLIRKLSSNNLPTAVCGLRWKHTGDFIPPEDAKEIRVSVPWGHFAGKEWGNRKGFPIICLHGYTDNAGTFDTIAPMLSTNHHYVAVDAIGHGLSSHQPPGVSLNFWELLISVKRVANHYNFKKFALLGHSMGAGTSLLYGAIFPEDVERVLLLDLIKPIILPLLWHPQDPAVRINTFLATEKKLDSIQNKVFTLDEMVQRYIEGNLGGTVKPESVKILLKRGAKPSPDGTGYVFTRDIRTWLPVVTPSNLDFHRETMKSFTSHLKIIKGKQGPLYEPKPILDEFISMYKKQCKSFEYVEVEGSHHVHLDHPERVAPLVNDFFQQLPTSAVYDS